jgi:hypothetical protein
MRKHVARALLVLTTLTMLGGAGPQNAVGKHINGRGGHRGGHHCFTGNEVHRHNKAFYKNQAQQQGIKLGRARQQHRHHHHVCKFYPPA